MQNVERRTQNEMSRGTAARMGRRSLFMRVLSVGTFSLMRLTGRSALPARRSGSGSAGLSAGLAMGVRGTEKQHSVLFLPSNGPAGPGQAFLRRLACHPGFAAPGKQASGVARARKTAQCAVFTEQRAGRPRAGIFAEVSLPSGVRSARKTGQWGCEGPKKRL